MQIFPADLFEEVSIRRIPLHNEDLRQGASQIGRDARVARITKSLQEINLPFLVDVHDTVALTYIDGLSLCENYFMEAVYASGRFPCLFIGGSAVAKPGLIKTFIFDGRQIVENHAVTIFLKLRQGRSYGVFKSQNFEKTGQSFMVISADPDRRVAFSVVDNVTDEVRPFAQVLAETFNTTPIDVKAKMDGYSFGIEIENELFVRAVKDVNAETGSVSFFCDINPGDRLELLKSTDFVEQTKRDVALFLKDRPQPLGAILNDCLLRRRNNESQLVGLSQIWPMPVAGFSTFGELFGININQTLTALAFFNAEETAFRDPFIADFPIRYARFLNSFFNRQDLSRANLMFAKKKLEEEAKRNSVFMKKTPEVL